MINLSIHNSVNFNCPCKNNSIAITLPYYVGSDYYCESGVNIYCPWNTVIAADPLWDGQQCGGGGELKSLLHTSPHEDIELRLWSTWSNHNIDTPLDFIELLV